MRGPRPCRPHRRGRRRRAGGVPGAFRRHAGGPRRAAHRSHRADALPEGSVAAARQAADDRHRDARALSRSDHQCPARRWLLDAEREPSAAGDAQAWGEVGHRAGRARPGSRVQDSRAQHRKGSQPQREVARDDTDAARAGRRAQREHRAGARVRVRSTVLPDAWRRLRGAAAPERRRLSIRCCVASRSFSTSVCRAR